MGKKWKRGVVRINVGEEKDGSWGEDDREKADKEEEPKWSSTIIARPFYSSPFFPPFSSTRPQREREHFLFVEMPGERPRWRDRSLMHRERGIVTAKNPGSHLRGLRDAPSRRDVSHLVSRTLFLSAGISSRIWIISKIISVENIRPQRERERVLTKKRSSRFFIIATWAG